MSSLKILTDREFARVEKKLGPRVQHVYLSWGTLRVDGIETYSVVDGKQAITSITLMEKALLAWKEPRPKRNFLQRLFCCQGDD